MERTALTLIDHLRAPDWSFFLGLLEPHGTFGDTALHPRRVLRPRTGPRTRRELENLGFALRAAPRMAWYVRRTQALLDRVDPDILFTHSGVDVLLAGALARRRRAVWVNNVGSDVLADFGEKHPWSRPAMRRFLSAAYRRPDHVVTVSEGLRRRMIDDFGVPAAKVSVIPNPVDIARVQDGARAESANVPGDFFLGVGRLTKGKGFDLLIRAGARVAKEGRPVRVVILGEGEDHEPLLQLARSLGVELSLPGYDPNPWRLMRDASAVVVPSYNEGFSYVIVEAMACGAPVVATDCFGPRDIVTDGVDGTLVPVGNERALADALLALLRDQALRARYRAAGLERAQAYSVPRVTEDYLSLFRRLTPRGR